jgi:hypothetical protein
MSFSRPPSAAEEPHGRPQPPDADAYFGRVLRGTAEGTRFDADHARQGAPLPPSERRDTDGTGRRAGDDALRTAPAAWPPHWPNTGNPHLIVNRMGAVIPR